MVRLTWSFSPVFCAQLSWSRPLSQAQKMLHVEFPYSRSTEWKLSEPFPRAGLSKGVGRVYFCTRNQREPWKARGGGRGRKGEYQRQALSCPSMWWVCPQHTYRRLWASSNEPHVKHWIQCWLSWSSEPVPPPPACSSGGRQSALPSWYINERSLLGLAASGVPRGCSGGDGLAAGRGKQDKLSPPCLFRRFSLKLFTTRQIDLSKAQIWAYCSPT